MYPYKRSPRQSGQRAFTLVELLVVIAIIGVLVALLLPAIQAARESARRNTCINHLKQLALGCLNHENAMGHFPGGGWGNNWVGDADRGSGKDQPGSWLYSTLPYLEATALHGLPSDGDPNETGQSQANGAAIAMMSTIPIVNCPTRRAGLFAATSDAYANNAARLELVARDSGSATPASASGPASANHSAAFIGVNVGRTDYAGCSGADGMERDGQNRATGLRYPGFVAGDRADTNVDGPNSIHVVTDTRRAWDWWVDSPTGNMTDKQGNFQGQMTGVFFQRSEIGIQNIGDGTSNTYLIGEKTVTTVNYDDGRGENDERTWLHGSSFNSIRPASERPVPDPTVFEEGSTFGSAHASVWQMAFCDGHVEALSFDIDHQLHSRYGARDDGGTTNRE